MDTDDFDVLGVLVLFKFLSTQSVHAFLLSFVPRKGVSSLELIVQ